MKQLLFLSLLLLSLAGCTAFKEMQTTVVNRYDVSTKLSAAVKELEQGRTTVAATILEALVAEPGVKGVTDEALFRLSLLRLPHEEKDGSMPSILYLERLRRDYRDSVWTQQSKPLLDLLHGIADIKKQNRSLKSLNSSLTKDNKELLQNIERLKNLDIQLERKSR
jgi:hypothetical protein